MLGSCSMINFDIFSTVLSPQLFWVQFSEINFPIFQFKSMSSVLIVISTRCRVDFINYRWWDSLLDWEKLLLFLLCFTFITKKSFHKIIKHFIIR